jgi:N12 class adenine-specific DNA methylase
MKDINTVLNELSNPQQNGLVVDNEQGAFGDSVDALQKGLYDGVAGVAEFVGADGVRDWATENSDAQLGEMSQAGRDAMSKQFFQDDETGSLEFGDAWSDPRSIAMQVAHMMGMNADILVGGGLVKGGRIAITQLSKQIKKKLGQKIKDPAILDEAARKGTETYLSKLSTKYGAEKVGKAKELAERTFDYGAATHAVSSGLEAIDIRDEVSAMDYDDLMQSDAFKDSARRIKAANPNARPTEILEAARGVVANIAANNVKTNPALLASNFLVGGLGGVALEKLIRGAIPAGAGVAAEFVTEGVQGGTEQYAHNAAIQNKINPEQDLSEGVLSAGLNEAVAGAGSSGAVAGGRNLYERATGQYEPNKGKTPPVDETNPAAEGTTPPVQETPIEQPPVEQDLNPNTKSKEEAADLADYFDARYRSRPTGINDETGEFEQTTRPPYLMRKDGKPYDNETQARQAASRAGLTDYSPKPVKGGVVMERPAEKPPEIPNGGLSVKEKLKRRNQSKQIDWEVSQREKNGGFLNKPLAKEAQEMLKAGAAYPDVMKKLDEAFTDPTRAAIDKWNSEGSQPKDTDENGRDDKHNIWHERNQQALTAEQKKDRIAAKRAAEKPARDEDYTRAELQRGHEQYRNEKLKEIEEIKQLERPTVTDIAAAVKRKRKRIKKNLSQERNLPSPAERELAQKTKQKLEAVISTYNKPLKDSPDYQPNNVFADAIMNVKAVQKAIEQAPDPVKERKLVNDALLEMAAEAERELTGQPEQDNFEAFQPRPVDSVNEDELFGDDAGFSLDDMAAEFESKPTIREEETAQTPSKGKNFASAGAQSEAERQEQASQLEASSARQPTKEEREKKAKSDEKQTKPSSKKAFHGTLEDFDSPAVKKTEAALFGDGLYLTSDENDAKGYASNKSYNPDSDIDWNRDLQGRLELKASVISGEQQGPAWREAYQKVKEDYNNRAGKVYEVEYAEDNALILDEKGLDLTSEKEADIFKLALAEADVSSDDAERAIRLLNNYERRAPKSATREEVIADKLVLQMEILSSFKATKALRQYASLKNKDALIIRKVNRLGLVKDTAKNTDIDHIQILNDRAILSSTESKKAKDSAPSRKPKRINWTLDNLEAPGLTPNQYDINKKPEYFKKEKGRVSTVEKMTPDEYIEKAAAVLGITKANFLRGRNDTEWLENAIAEGQALGMPYLDYVNDGQEGAHRALAAKKQGFKEIDVQVIKPVPVDEAANEAATSPTNDTPEPTPAQIEAGNYKKGHIKASGFDISIENPKGSTRRGTDEKGKPWENEMQHHYGDIKGTTGADGDPVDVFVGDDHDASLVYVVNQVNPDTRAFDEHKVMVGFNSIADARDAYEANYDKGWKGLDSIVVAKPDTLKKWLSEGDTTKPYPKKSKQDAPAMPTSKPSNGEPLTIVPKSEKAFTVQGAGPEHEDKLKSMHGNYQGPKRGWVFSNRRREEVENYLNEVNGEQASKADDKPVDADTAARKDMLEVLKMLKPNSSAPMPVTNSAWAAIHDTGDKLPGREKFELIQMFALPDSTVTQAGMDKAIGYLQSKITPEKNAASTPDEKEDNATARNLAHTKLLSGLAKRGGVRNTKGNRDKIDALLRGDLNKNARTSYVVYYGLLDMLGKDVSNEKVAPYADFAIETLGSEVEYNMQNLKKEAHYYKDEDVADIQARDKAPWTDFVETLKGRLEAGEGEQGKKPESNEVDKPPKTSNNDNSDQDGINDDAKAGSHNAASGTGNAEVSEQTAESTERGSDGDGESRPTGNEDVASGNGARPDNSAERSDKNDNPESRFRLDDVGDIANGTASQRVAANLAAIRLSRQLQSEKRKATDAEKAILAKFVGWGGLKRVFDNVGNRAKFELEAYAELKELLTPAEFNAASNSIRTAFYTSKDIVKAMWAGVEAFNLMPLTGKMNIVEPSIGTGNFIGWQPDSLRDKSKWSATELEPITGNIAQQIYEEAAVKVSGFEDAAFRKGVFSLAIGNPPFGDQPLYDKKNPDISGLSLHNFMIAKSAKLLHENGLMMMVITHNFLDTKNANHSDLSKSVDFVGAVRLPNTAFKSNASTEVTTDVVVFRKLKKGEVAQNTVWTDTEGEINGIRINKYFEQNPQNILGRLADDGKLNPRTDKELTVHPTPEHADITKSLTRALKNMAKGVDLSVSTETTDAIAGEVMITESELSLGGFMINEDGKVMYRFDDTGLGANVKEITPATVLNENGQKLEAIQAVLNRDPSKESLLAHTREHLLNSNGNPSVTNKPFLALYDYIGFNGKEGEQRVSESDLREAIATGINGARIGENNYNKLRGLLKIRNTALALVKAEKQDLDNIESLRSQLNREYDAFTTDFGTKTKPTSLSANIKLLGDDISLESALDTVKADGTVEKHDIFTKRMIQPFVTPKSAKTLDDAVTYSIQARGRVDVEYVATLRGISKAEAKSQLTGGDKPYLYLDPATDSYVFIDDYLAGNVKRKYQEATAAGLTKNAEMLKAVLPADKPANKVKASIRATWLDASVFENFLSALGYDATVSVSPTLGKVTLDEFKQREHTELGAQFISDVVPLSKLFEHATAGKSIKIFKQIGPKETVKDEKGTKTANLLANKLTDLFSQWITSNDEMRQHVADNFNERVNTHIERKFNGRLYFTPVGANPVVELRKTQLDGALRIVQSTNSLLDHTVGAGKTYTQIAGIMERKRLGLSKKPLLAVPNHIIGSFADDFYKLYPGANILVVSEKQMNAQNRRKFFSRIATSDYDAIIIGHSHLKNLPNSPAAEERVIGEKLDELRSAKEEAKRAAKEAGRRGASVAQIEEAIDRLNSKLKELKEAASEKDDDIGLNFEDMGIDYLAIDEAHEFKNLMYSTSSDRVVGMNDPKGSQKAFDLLVKVRSVQGLGQRGGVSFMTGTPISNSLVELYTMMYYLGYEDLKDNNISHYDAFAGSFLNTETAMEYTPTGTLKERVVLKGLNNVKELATKYRQFGDVITREDMKRIYAEDTAEKNQREGKNKSLRFPIPNVKGGTRQIDLANATKQQVLYNDALIARMETINNIKGRSERQEYAKVDNPLWVMSDAKKASLDVRMVDPEAARDKTGKIARASKNIKRIYDKWEADKGTQLVFSDMGVPVRFAQAKAKSQLKEIAKKFIPSGAKYIDSQMTRLDGTDGIYSAIIEDIQSRLEVGAARGDIDPDLHDAINEDLHKNAGLFLTADVGFSVYDDLKASLIEQGVPEKEIAFIHDHDTQIKKDKLFAQVRAGRIRVLIGSSFKMGAGTNVQDRVVALHHMDAPWRPSEMEQREGRIIRQGNKLYERAAKAGNPDKFEVEIIAYATQGSSDPVMWQILERKAGAIEQFRQGEIDEFTEEGESDSDSFAELKAQTTGNPVYRDKLVADGELLQAETDLASKRIQYDSAARFVRNYDGAKKSEEMISFATASARITGYDTDALHDTLHSNQETFIAETDRYNAAMEVYEALSDKAKKAAKKPKAPKNPPILSIKHPYITDLKKHFIDKVDEAVKSGGRQDQTIEWEVGNNMRVVADIKPTSSEVDTTAMFVDLSLRIGRSKRMLTFTGDGPVKSLSGSVKRIKALLPNSLMAEVADLRASAKKRLARLEKNIGSARTAADKKPDSSKADAAKARNEWLDVEVQLADKTEDLRRSKIPNKYIDNSHRPIKRSTFNPANLEPKEITIDGHTYQTLGMYAEVGSGNTVLAPAYDIATGKPVHLGMVKISDEQGYESNQIVKQAPKGVKAGDYKAIAKNFAEAKAEAEAKASTEDKDIPLALSKKVARGNINKADAVAIIQRLDSRISNRGTGTIVVTDHTEYPQDVKRLFKSRPELMNTAGFLHDGKAYINLSEHSTLNEVEETYIHERFRHFGFRQYLGQDVEKILVDMHNALGRDKVIAMLNDLGVPTDAYIDYYSKNKSASPKDLSFGLMDELLAYLEPKDAPVTLKQKIRVWVTKLKIKLRKMGFEGLIKYSDKDLLGVIHGSVSHLKTSRYDANRKRTRANAAPSPIFNPTKSIENIGNKALEHAKRMNEKGWKNVISDPLDDSRKHWLGLIPRRYLEEFAGKLMPSMKAYMKRAKQMDADINELKKSPAEIVDGWREYASKYPEEARQLIELMHDTTIAGIDPSILFEPLRDNVDFSPRNIKTQHDDLATGQYITPEYVAERIKTLKAQAKERSGEGTAKFMERIKYLKARLAMQRRREDEEPRIRKVWENLTPEGKQLYIDVKKSYEKQHDQYREALEARIMDEIDDGRHREKFRDYIKQLFETQRLDGPYFPLARFGDYFAVVRDSEENVIEFSKFETKDKRRQWAEQRQELLEPGEKIHLGKIADTGSKSVNQVDPKYHTEVMMMLDANNAGGALMDDINQLYLSRLPAVSMRKQFIHRKKTAGFNPDAMRAYSHNMFHAAYQVGRLRHSHKMQVYLDDMREEAALSSDEDKAVDIYGEMVKRHDWAMNPTGSAWTAKATSLGFAWYLGVTPAAAFVNTTQTWMVGLPVLGARYGFVESAKALLKASMDFVKGGFHVDKILTDKAELAAFRELERRGTLEKTLAHDLAGVAEGGLNYSSVGHKVMTYVSLFFHHAERYNREVTAMAAFRLARKAGDENPVDTADNLTLDSHFDYSNAERARFMQNDAAKVLLLFRQHSLNMTYRLLRDTNNAMRGESAEVKRIARRQLSGILGMTGLFAGTAGLPFLYFGADIIASSLFGDEDEPFEFEVEFRKFLAEHVGETAAQTIVHGVADVATGASISGRIGMNSLWFREADPTLEGRGLVQYYAEQALGPIVGMAFSAGTAYDIAQKGQLLRGFEYALPKVGKDALRGLRYMNEGASNLRGDSMIEDMTGLEEFYQFMGFTPTRIAESYEQNSAIKGYEKHILYRRQLLMNQYATAKRMRDREFLRGVKSQIDKFNDINPEVKITPKTLLRSMRTRERYSEKNQRGIQVDDRLQERLSDLMFIRE